ncbi:unnamed protein product [Closterium sp. NIES-54]
MVVVLERQFHTVKINECDAVQGAFDQLRDLCVKLSAAGVDYHEKIKCYKALSLLPESWSPLVVNLNGMKDSWSLEWIRAQVLQEEFRRKELTAAAGEGGGSAYGMKGFKGHDSKKGKAKEGSGGEQYSGGKHGNKGGKQCDSKCWYCHVEGHTWFKCRKLPDGWRPGQPSIECSKGVHGAMGEGMGSEEGDRGAGGHGGMFYHVGEACSKDMVVPASKVALHHSSHWVIDAGAFMTMTNREDLLDEVRPSKAPTVVSATGQEAAARLAAEAVKRGHASHVTSGGGGDGSDGGLLVHGVGALPSVTPSTGETDWLTAHRRFGHVALPQLQQLFKEERVKGLRIKGEPKEVGSCETCLTSKFLRFPFHSAVGQSSDPVELVHVDLVGPMKVKGDGGALYSMTMVDDYTRLTWYFPLAKKSDAARVIIEEWMPMVERESGKRVKAIRSERGGAFLGVEFRSWLKRHGIKQQLTTAYTPQSNGMAGKANRTIIEGRRTMLVDSSLPLRFWPLAIRHATIIKNRVLTHVGAQHCVPMEKWSGKKPLVDILCVFECMGLMHVPKEKRDKLQAAAVWAVHFGLARVSKGWLMWDPKSNTIFTTRDAKFMEGLMFKEWSERGKSKVTIPLGIEVGTNDPLLIPIEFSSSSELTEVSHDLGGAEGEAANVEGVLQQGEAPVAERGDTEEEVQQPIPSPKLPPRRTTQGKRDAVRGGAKEGAAKERPKRAAHPRDFLKYERIGGPKALLVQEEEDEEEKGAKGEMEQICCFGVNLPHEPASMDEALAGDDREAWLASREDDFKSHMENETWTLTNLPPGRKALDCTWVLCVKTDAEGKLERRKTRLVIKGFQQREGIHFQDVFAPIAKAPTLRVLLAAAVVCGWKVEQMDVKTAFLYGVVDEEIYMKQPEGYDDGSGRICRLNKAIYGLKQAPRCWYARLVEGLEALGFKVSGCDESLFTTEGEEEKVFLLVYVDDILLFSPSLERIKEVQGNLKETFQCKALGPVGYYLGLHVERDETITPADGTGTAPCRPFFYPQPQSSLPQPELVLRQVLSLLSSTGLSPPLLCPPSDQSQPQLLLGSSLLAPAPHTEVTGSLSERRELETHAFTPVRARRVARSRPLAVLGTHVMALCPSSVPQRVVLPEPPASSLPHVPDPDSDLARTASPTITRLLATVVTDPDFEFTAAFPLVTELVDFATRSRLEYVASLVTKSKNICPPSIGGEPSLSSDVLEDRQFELECLVVALPHFASMMLCPEGDPDALDIPTPRSYAEAIASEYSSQTAMDAEMASWNSTGTYVDEVPPPRANIVDGMWIFIMKRPPGSSPSFKTRYVARGFTQRQGVNFFYTFSPTPKMTTLWVLLHAAAQRDYELHSLGFSTAFLQCSLHEEIWLRRPPGFNGSFPAGTQWSLRRPVYGLHQAPREWHDTLRTTLAALGFAPSYADPSLFLRTNTTLLPFYVLVYVDGLVYATADTETLALVNAELQERHSCTDLVQYIGMGLVLGGRGSVVLTGHSDASWADDQATQRSSQGCTFSLGSASVSWRSIHYSFVLGSSCEAEIYGGAMAIQELRWPTYLLTDLGERPCSPPVLYVDNKAMLALCHEQRLEHRTKHIALCYFLARELKQRGQLHLSYVASRANTADVFTKALGPGDHQRFCTALGLLPTVPHMFVA